MKKRIILSLCLVAALLVTGWALLSRAGMSASTRESLMPGNTVVPTTRSPIRIERSALTDRIEQYWAKKPLGDWESDGKIDVPRVLMARFLLGHDPDALNEYLLSLSPWGHAGSTWALHKKGDYDFTLSGLVPILFLFGNDPDVLYPETRNHLINVLLTLEGGDPQVKVPRTLGLVRDTENHLLMTEGSRYLKNRWLELHGRALPKHDNIANGLEEWLLELIEELRTAGLYEFNSIPYEGYTLIALLNLEAFGSDTIKAASRALLDQLNWRYAMGSLRFRRFPPFRRQTKHAKDTALDGDRHTALIKTWMSLNPEGPTGLSLSGSHHIALWACWSPYRLPDETARWVLEKPSDYLVRMGHGPDASPEIYSGGPGWLLTAGGVNRGRRSMIVARPITLLLDDDATDLSQVLHLAGPTNDFRQWNHTGVWKKFAVAAGPVRVPDGWTPDATGKLWNVYRKGPLCIAVHSLPDLGVVHLVRSDDPEAVMEAVEKANADAAALANAFQVPGGSRIEYDVTAPKNRWCIKRIDDRPTDRFFDQWPLMKSEFEAGSRHLQDDPSDGTASGPAQELKRQPTLSD